MHANPSDRSAPGLQVMPSESSAGVATLRGRWTAEELTSPQTWQATMATLSKATASMSWDLTKVQAFDHLGALLLWHSWGKRMPQKMLATPSQQALLQRLTNFKLTLPAAQPTSWSQKFNDLGIKVQAALAQIRDFVALMGQLLLDGLRLMTRPRFGPWRDFSGHLYRIGAQALPITALVGFLIGVVLAYLLSRVLRQFSAETFIVDILGLALVRELGPLLAAVLIAGRSGSAITAQIGVMRVTEELDAMRVMGISPGFRLVLPRALALAVAMPLISVWTILAALAGSMMAADLSLHISPSYFIESLPKAVPLANLNLALGKSVLFGLSIALIGCFYGLRIEPNTDSLGRGTTASVVTAITAVIVIDALAAVLFNTIGI